ncbi:hypothetical protein BN946_scf185027.g14 [Trametes cinnabarina]|uniref:Uncharacterized protein n=1 Tax=Pycnoporus cinnabarinus TaxID=5643 RepID=A0A060SPP5_PYCCI|nr:hypothetical protein BN946_scf185027.g14 [Trametes cinnabarina]
MDTSPTSLFDSYEQDFSQIIQSIRDKLEGDGKDAQGGASVLSASVLNLAECGKLTAPSWAAEQRKAALRRVEMELDEADEMRRAHAAVAVGAGAVVGAQAAVSIPLGRAIRE